MITALDSSVLWATIKQESGHESWLHALLQAASEGPLVISPIAFAELAPSTRDEVELAAFLDRLSIAYEPISPAAAHLAGQTFKRYRQAGGPRQHLVPDFVIAAHAQIQADRLAAIDLETRVKSRDRAEISLHGRNPTAPQFTIWVITYSAPAS